MKYKEFCIKTWMYTGELLTCCNLYKRDVNFTKDKVIKYENSQFYLMDFSTGFHGKSTEMLDYTLMDEAALFQESLVFDKKYICTLEEMIEIQNKIKCVHRECIDKWCKTGETDFSNHFNLGERVMEFDFLISVHTFKNTHQYFCNLNKGDLMHSANEYIHFMDGKFTFIDYSSLQYPHQDMPDYTIMNEAELFQASLVFDKKYICTFEEVITIQNEMKEYASLNKPNEGINQEYKFNIEIPK
ncbi:hypothetical protein N0S44_000383 [Escherichia coli]|nr:hypothetical protein [Escherichia coli]EJR1979228.1 hypothetical protein [Escherichia coli]UTS53689.1 hypothetical protein UES1_321 [Escherichia phage UE-S1]